MKNIVYTVETICQLHEIIGIDKPKHPLISVIDYSRVDVGNAPKKGGFTCDFYSINFKKYCSFLYGRQPFDHKEGTLHCTAPGQIITYDKRKEKDSSEGLGLYFHPELIRKTALGSKINDYTFFAYNANEALHLSEQEKQILITLFGQIRIEYNTNIDVFTQELIISNIELLLNYCKRFYNRQFITRTNQSKDVIIEFEKLLLNYFKLRNSKENNIPTVKFCAGVLNLSPNYLSDLLKKETGKSAKEHIHLHLLEKSKTQLLNTNKSIKEIAYSLGFEYSQSFSKLFKKKTGLSPSEFRITNN